MCFNKPTFGQLDESGNEPAPSSGLGSSGKVAPYKDSSRGRTSSKTFFALLLGFFQTLIFASATI
jgi:hypothetical protein